MEEEEFELEDEDGFEFEGCKVLLLLFEELNLVLLLRLLLLACLDPLEVGGDVLKKVW